MRPAGTRDSDNLARDNVAEDAHVDRFNLATMSGVYPGSRTQVHQRVRLSSFQGQRVGWAQLFWYTEPESCVVILPADDDSPRQPVRLTEPQRELIPRLKQTLADAGWQLQCCGSCHFWQATTSDESGLPAGHCRLGEQVPPALACQSGLALACPHWQAGENTQPAGPVSSNEGAPAPLRKIAEISDSKLRFWPRLWRRLKNRYAPAAQPSGWEARLVERSGVGAGTEPCFVCQGRIANLGALAVENDEGDQQTYSIWRCRVCFTTYLQDWVDRWVRLDNLETEETYFRVNPAEAGDLLQLFYGIAGAEHPARRRERTEQRAKLRAFVRDRAPLSRQIRQGR